MKSLKILIAPKGGITVEADGFTGQSCAKATAELLEKLGGQVTSEDPKPEFYEHDQGEQQKHNA